MASRKWLVRSLYLAFLAALGGGALLVYTWMRPEFIRSELIQQLTGKFNDVDVQVQTARLRFLGGITVNDLKIIRQTDPTRTPLLHVPSAILHHDKEQLNNGRLVIRKVEMFKPRLVIERDLEGKWNFTELMKPSRDEEPAPIFVLHDATIVIIDRMHGDTPLAELKNVEATIVNDPAPIFTFQIKGTGRPTGAFTINAKFDKRTGFAGSFDLPSIPIGPDLVQAIECFCPDAGDYAQPLSGQASAHLDLVWRSGPRPVLHHDLRVQLLKGRYAHQNLPVALDEIEAVIRSKNGDLIIEKATARAGQGTISVSMDLPREAPYSTPSQSPGLTSSSESDCSSIGDFEQRLRSLEVAIANMELSPDIFAMLPGRAAEMNGMLQPLGRFSVNYNFKRQNGNWQKRLAIEPHGAEAKYQGFPYRVRNLRGQVVQTSSANDAGQIAVDLSGEGLGTTVTMKGTIKGKYPDVDVNFRIEGKDATLDDELINAMPDENPEVLRRLHATAHGDFVALLRHNERVRREYGPDVFDNHFTITVNRASMKYEDFPFLLENMKGLLVVRTVPERPTRLPVANGQAKGAQAVADGTTLEFHNFQATHGNCKIRGSGRKDPAPGGAILSLTIDAESLPLDRDLQEALAAIRMSQSWKSFSPSGIVNLAARVKLFTRYGEGVELNPAEDLEMGLAFAGGVIKPMFFPYVLHDLAGRFAYAKGKVDLRDFSAKHGPSSIELPTAEVLFRPSGGYWADLRSLKVNPLVIDTDFLEALSPGLRTACEGLRLQGPMALQATRVVIDEQPGPFIPRNLPVAVRGAVPKDEPSPLELASERSTIPKPILPTIYWDGQIALAGASLTTGVDWENVHGTLASWGLYKGDHLGAVRGNIVFDKATVARQPVESINASLRVDPRQPDILSIPSITGKLYGGDIGGEAWVAFDSPTRYALQLNAARVRLSEIAKHQKLPPKSHLEGLASAQLYLANRLDERTGQYLLQGGGAIDVPNGKMLNLPVLLNLIKVVKLRAPDDTGFEEAHAIFYLSGDRIRFGQLDLIGNAISLGGEGEMKIDGTNARFEFYPVWTKLKEMFALPGDWTGAISKKFLKIRVTGDLNGELDYKAEPVPGLVDPVKRVINRVK